MECPLSLTELFILLLFLPASTLGLLWNSQTLELRIRKEGGRGDRPMYQLLLFSERQSCPVYSYCCYFQGFTIRTSMFQKCTFNLFQILYTSLYTGCP